jgi:predicted GIY-YIG superfamily endonuclease
MTSVWYSYRLFAADDVVLYVGSTKSLTERLYKHRARPGWGAQIARIEATIHASKTEAIAAEVADRQALRPLHSLDRDLLPKDVQLAPGELQRRVLAVLELHGPLTSTGVFERLVKDGYTGPLTSATTTILRLARKGLVEAVGTAPSGTGRWPVAKVYAARARTTRSAA